MDYLSEIISVVVLAGGGIASYYNLKIKLARLEEKQKAMDVQIIEAKSDAHQTGVKLFAELKEIQKTLGQVWKEIHKSK